MQSLSIGAQFAALAFLLVLSAMSSMTETVMMASNRYRLRSLASAGHRGAQRAIDLLSRTDRLLGVILLFNNLVNVAAATLASVITINLFGEESWALAAGTVLLTFFILVFSEITPKVIGAHYADRLALFVSYPLTFLLRVSYPAVWFVNLFVSAILKLLRLELHGENKPSSLSVEELRSMVLESGQYIAQKNRDMLVNLFDLEHITVEDVMIPRGMIESIDLRQPTDEIRKQIATSYHTRLPVLEGDNERVVGVLHLRRVASRALESGFEVEDVREMVAKPYFIPADTHVYTQLQFFQENRQRMALVVDEYGELLGLVTVDDIIEEIIGKFTTSQPEAHAKLDWNTDGSALVDGGQNLRELNRRLDLDFPLDGPKTLNGLILEHLEDIPEADLSVRINGIAIEVVQAEDKMVRLARIFRPEASAESSGIDG
ncbi:HlyC/CorC family transporter [Pseudazoarcus pumilus]|uniref:Magnesium and cobalt efflux protein CorC n=1 Tax=Pseudazoarcus pumilus TaxID=2067960 RepID=A0A2I6S4S2_9RHOO|nr:HlyC/CorC family transporter [Pseudazoarcus pumilus]AUN94254.1 magnesium and cobalt efflux protein CorC [Pseudazoarcus pumilus]